MARVQQVPSMAGRDLASVVTAGHRYHWSEREVDFADANKKAPRPDVEKPLQVVVYDFGVKRGILRQLVGKGCQVTVVPAQTIRRRGFALNPDGMMLSNGPGDPEPVEYAAVNVKKLIGKSADFRHLPWASNPCVGHRCQIIQDALRSPRREPPGSGPEHR